MTPKQILTVLALFASFVASPVLLGFGLLGPRAVPPSNEPLARQAVEVVIPDARHFEAAALLDLGRERYAEEGLHLPEITLVVQESLRECSGRVGRYDERTNELWLCRLDFDTVLHELAHAWIDLNMDDADRADFIERRGMPEWNDRSQPWAERGSEQAAEILVWALSDAEGTVRWVEDGNESRRLLSISKSSPDELRAGYELMVGEAPQRRSAIAPFVETFSPEAARQSSPPAP